MSSAIFSDPTFWMDILARPIPPSLLPPLSRALCSATAGAQAAPTTGRLLVSLKRPDAPRAQAAAVRAFAASVRARPVGRPVPQIGLVTVTPRKGESPHALAVRLRSDPRVRAVAVERRASFRADPGDPALHIAESA